MKSKITYPNSSIEINTIESESKEKSVDFEVSQEGQTKYKTILSVSTRNEKFIIAMFWYHFSEDADINYFWIEETQTLFLGAGSVSAVINLKENIIKDINYPMLFWSWKAIEEYVLELGETECRVYSKSGELIGQTDVDPPYDYIVTEDAVEFTSIVMDKRKIKLKHG
jgi:hypothetical protein